MKILFSLCLLALLGLVFAQNDVLTLRLALPGEQRGPIVPYVLEFTEQVKTLSNGSMILEPTWDAGAQDPNGPDAGVIKLVKAGEFDVGIVSARAWDNEGVKSFQALQAPFLIDNDALAEAVATSDIATQMLNGLSSSGFVGLTLWPEDLRHPFAIPPQAPLLSPEDFAGLTIRAIPSVVAYKLIEALGATPAFVDSDYQGAESGLLQGASLTGTPVATGNVIFFPKYQVLFANGTMFEKLTDEQRSILHEAAAATQKKAISEHPQDADNAAAWCADGGAIVLASDEQVASFENAAQPVFDEIAQDPLNAELIAAIRDLKEKTEPSPGAQACGSVATQASSDSSLDIQVWSEGFPPNGVWKAELSVDDFVNGGELRSNAELEAGLYTFIFQDAKAEFRFQGQESYSCKADSAVVEDFVRFTYEADSPCHDVADDIQWRLEDDGLHFNFIATRNSSFLGNKILYETKPYQKIE